MTVIKPNSIAGIVSVTAQGDVINFYKSDGTLAGLEIGGARINASGVSTFSSLQTTNLNVSGVGTIATLTVTGNASIGGTVTYMDVTNVDSVGIITAQQGIQVLANGINVTGVSTVAAGTAAAPSITPTGDSNTGIFFPSADTIAFSEGGVEAARIDSSGRLAIGTTSPSVLVHGAVSSGAANLRLENTANSGEAGLQLYGKNSGGTVRTALFKYDASDYFRIATASAVAIAFETSDAERARIDSSGRLLVGTTTARTDAPGGTEGFLLEGTSTTNSQNRFTQFFYGEAGPASPYIGLAKHRSTSIGGNTVVQSGDELGGIYFQGSDGSTFKQGAHILAYVDGTPGTNDMPGRLVFSTTADGASSPTEAMRINSSQKIGLGSVISAGGVQTTGAWLTAYGNASNNTSSVPIECYAPSTSSRFLISFGNPNGVVGSISTNASATAYNTSSDYRLKENVTAVTDGITRLQQLKPSRFNFIADPAQTVDGFIAHEVQAIVPEAITGKKDEVDEDGNPVYQGIDQSKLVPLLTAALQEAVAKIETLQGMVAVNNITIDEQQHQISALATRLTALESA